MGSSNSYWAGKGASDTHPDTLAYSNKALLVRIDALKEAGREVCVCVCVCVLYAYVCA